MYPKLLINLDGIQKNAEVAVAKCSSAGLSITAITKVFCGNEKIANTFLSAGVTALGDSRIENIKRYENLECEKWLIRMPMFSEVKQCVKYCDVSVNSELKTISLLNTAAGEENTKHKVVLMVDLGDLREGYFDIEQMMSDIEQILNMDNITLYGIGTNLTCYGAIIPTSSHMKKLTEIASEIENKYDINLQVISGGNSSTYTLLEEGKELYGINNLRLGEVILLGTETSYGKVAEQMKDDNFILESQIIELKEKPSLPIGESGKDAFGNSPEFEDKGMMKRAIIALGRQDIHFDNLTPFDEKIEVLGASSDHTILDVTNTDKDYKLGDIIRFKLDYGNALAAMTSEYVNKEFTDE